MRATATPEGTTTPRRADARRNVVAILDAAERRLARDPDASMNDIAEEAGLGRVTLYGHFKSRQALIESVVRRVLDAANESLQDVDLSGDATGALQRLVDATWVVTARSGRLVVAAERALPPTMLRDAHDGGLEVRVRRFVEGAQETGEFRSDLTTDWLVAVFHAVVHVAATEVDAGRLDREAAPGVIAKTMIATFVPPTHNGDGHAPS